MRGWDEFTDLEKDFVQYKVSGANLSKSELDIKFGPAIQALSDNMDLRRYIADEKVNRKNKKHLIEDMKLREFAKTSKRALDVLIEVMENGSEAGRVRAATALGKPALRFLEKLAENSADLEFTFDDNGNAIRIDEQDKAL